MKFQFSDGHCKFPAKKNYVLIKIPILVQILQFWTKLSKKEIC